MENKFTALTTEELITIRGGQQMIMLNGGGRRLSWWDYILMGLDRCTNVHPSIPCP